MVNWSFTILRVYLYKFVKENRKEKLSLVTNCAVSSEFYAVLTAFSKTENICEIKSCTVGLGRGNSRWSRAGNAKILNLKAGAFIIYYVHLLKTLCVSLSHSSFHFSLIRSSLADQPWPLALTLSPAQAFRSPLRTRSPKVLLRTLLPFVFRSKP